MRRLSLHLVGSAVLFSLFAHGSAAEAPAIELPPGGDRFARTLYGKLAEESGNLAFSPASIDTCLLLAYAGARGETAAEMAKTLKLTEQEAKEPGRLLATAMARVSNQREPKGGAVLNVANSAWVDKGFPIQATYRQLVSKSGGATFEPVDFAKSPDAARELGSTPGSTSTPHTRLPSCFRRARWMPIPGWCWPTPFISRGAGPRSSTKRPPRTSPFIVLASRT